METLERRRIHDHQAGSPVKAQYRLAAVSLDVFLFHANALSPYAVLANASQRIPRKAPPVRSRPESSGFMADEWHFRRLKCRRFMSSLESTSDVSALTVISFFPLLENVRPLSRPSARVPPSRRNSRVRAQAWTVWRLDLPQSQRASHAEDAAWGAEIGVGLRGRARKRQAPSLPTSFVWISFQRVWPFFARRASLSVRSTVEPSWQEYPFMS